MRHRVTIRRLCCAVLLTAGLLPGFLAAAAEPTAAAAGTPPAEIPYRIFAAFHQLGRDLETQSSGHFQLTFQVLSINPAIAPADIQLVIHGRDGDVRIPLDENGRPQTGFRPARALLVENPQVVTNQPKGTMQLLLRFNISAPELDADESRWDYAVLVRECLACQKALADLAGEKVPAADRIAVRASGAPAGKVPIRLQAGKQITVIRPDAQGRYEIPVRDDWLKSGAKLVTPRQFTGLHIEVPPGLAERYMAKFMATTEAAGPAVEAAPEP